MLPNRTAEIHTVAIICFLSEVNTLNVGLMR